MERRGRRCVCSVTPSTKVRQTASVIESVGMGERCRTGAQVDVRCPAYTATAALQKIASCSGRAETEWSSNGSDDAKLRRAQPQVFPTMASQARERACQLIRASVWTAERACRARENSVEPWLDAGATKQEHAERGTRTRLTGTLDRGPQRSWASEIVDLRDCRPQGL
ncbi:hypothetical protein BU25DRAFT_57461 [Macroventuria anomochaeta]|uniref:Uncharacterized protein n=1 Tax=Macroventuria anomochaeta TaxID=301207 RepID=A0ACB6S119_9PLEO|nr:uncharacterized protein BU25DRAFT_57461 [Macroventuria anomochaeta]KAF2627662.1 hypothetical protein BU25DRAFT_57461 [Macroventuria anomochaeta]